jgi:hypothetical protein
MAMSPAEIERKVRQHDNDLHSIYEILGSIQTTQVQHGNRLDEVTAKLGEHDSRFDVVDSRFDVVDSRLDAVGAQLEQVLGLLRDGGAAGN